jgi:fluoroquinolone resistance protein
MKKDPHVDETFEKLDYSGSDLTELEFESCTFRNCDFSGSVLSKSLLTDCRLVDCNWSSITLKETGLRNVEFVGCKIVGVDFSHCLPLLFSIGFEKCSLDYSHFVRNKLKKTMFKECTVRDADFTESDLSGASFDDCDLSRTVFSHTNLSGADFRTARNFAISLETNVLKKARFSLSEAAGLLKQYGIIVE